MKKPNKQTSSRVSTIAGRLLRLLKQPGIVAGSRVIIDVRDEDGWYKSLTINARDLKSLAASALAQDETKGQKK